MLVSWERKSPAGGAAVPIVMLVFLLLLVALALPAGSVVHRHRARPGQPGGPSAAGISLTAIKTFEDREREAQALHPASLEAVQQAP